MSRTTDLAEQLLANYTGTTVGTPEFTAAAKDVEKNHGAVAHACVAVAAAIVENDGLAVVDTEHLASPDGSNLRYRMGVRAANLGERVSTGGERCALCPRSLRRGVDTVADVRFTLTGGNR